MKTPGHFHRQRTLPVQHFVDPATPTDDRHQIFGEKTHLLHAKLDRLDRIGKIEREMLPFIRLDQRDEDVEPLPLPRLRGGVHQCLDFLKRPSIVRLGPDGQDFHGLPFHTACTSIVPYWDYSKEILLLSERLVLELVAVRPRSGRGSTRGEGGSLGGEKASSATAPQGGAQIIVHAVRCVGPNG